jgi:hypothetical protein
MNEPHAELENLPQLFFFSAFLLDIRESLVIGDVHFIVRKSEEERDSIHMSSSAAISRA